jgi:membrane protease YdiL (CAAX protease family)
MIKKDRHLIDFLVFIFFLIITSIGLLSRRYFLQDNLSQFIADCLGNIGGVIVGSFLFIWWVKETRFRKREMIVFSVSIGLVLYEFLQIFIPWQTFDLKDIFGTFIGFTIASLINILVMIPDILRKRENKFVDK